MKKVSQTRQFSRDVKRMRKRGKDLDKLREVVRLLAESTPLPANYRDHPLIGPWHPSRDCHIEPDWILIYTAADKDSLRLERTGTHSDLFRK
jgi:mRNA interferase YafQ